MTRVVLLLAGVSLAPMQCSHEPDATHCWDDAPGDGLWELAGKFKDEHDEPATRQTLQAIVDRYPSSRWAPAAREQLAAYGAPVASPPRDLADAAPE
jgi:hypothetical protein